MAKSYSPDHILALDIGTEYVKAVLATPSSEQGTYDIVGIGRAHQAPENMTAGAISDIPGSVQVCETALALAEEQAGFTASQVVIGIAGELVKSASTSIRYVRTEPNSPITDDEIASLIRKIQAKAEKKAAELFASESANFDSELRLISSAITSIFIDGHKVTTPTGFKGRELNIVLYTAFAPLVHISAIEKVASELRLDIINIAVEPFAVARGYLGDDTESDTSAIIIDIGGGTTDVAIIDSGGIMSTQMFDVAGRAFTHAIANRLHVDTEVAEKLKVHLGDPRLAPSARSQVESAINKVLAIWLQGIDIALSDTGDLERLPANIYLSGGGAALEPLQIALATTDWYRDLSFVGRPLVDLLEASTFVGFNNLTDTELDQSYATAIGLVRVAADTGAVSPNDPKSVKSRFRRFLRN
jgi:cell division protein FtsA